ncbi:MAG: MFS transporter, partial [Candidatus Acidiferrales bacterium]
VWGLVVTMISYVGFEGALVFYNAYLPEIAPPSQQGRVSGWGFGVGYAGSLLGLMLALALIRNFAAPLGTHLTWLAIALCYFGFSLPAFLWLPKDALPKMSIAQAARGGIRESVRTFREIVSVKQTRRFLLAYFFYEDGVNTVIVSAAAFASLTLGFETQQLVILFAIVQVSALVGALLWARPTDRLGPKRVVSLMLVQWAVVVTAAFFVETAWHFYVVAVIAGSGLGAIQAASRAFMASLIPKGREGDFFGFYHLCGKSAAVIGPLLFGHVSSATGGNQRLAILSILILFIVGGLLLTRVRAGGPAVAEPAGPAL